MGHHETSQWTVLLRIVDMQHYVGRAAGLFTGQVSFYFTPNGPGGRRGGRRIGIVRQEVFCAFGAMAVLSLVLLQRLLQIHNKRHWKEQKRKRNKKR